MKPKTAALALVALLLAGLAPLAAQEGRAAPVFDGAAALRHVERLVAIGPRVAGSPGGVKARQYIVDSLRAAGVTSRFVAYPINAHNASDPVRQRDVQERWIGWIERYLNDATASGGRRR